MNNRVDRKKYVRAVVNDCGGVSRADADCGLTARIRRPDHTGTAGCKNEVNLLHDEVGHIEVGNVNPANNAFGCARLYRRFVNYLRRGNSAVFCAGVRAYYTAVARFKANQCLENSRRSGVRRGNNRADNSDGFDEFLNSVGGVLFDNSARFRVFVSIVNIFGGIMVLYDLILYNTHSRLFNGELCKGNSRLVCRSRASKKNFIHLLLSVSSENLLRRFNSANLLFQLFHAVADAVIQLKIHKSSFKYYVISSIIFYQYLFIDKIISN